VVVVDDGDGSLGTKPLPGHQCGFHGDDTHGSLHARARDSEMDESNKETRSASVFAREYSSGARIPTSGSTSTPARLQHGFVIPTLPPYFIL
jgi:hypothetical protein